MYSNDKKHFIKYISIIKSLTVIGIDEFNHLVNLTSLNA